MEKNKVKCPVCGYLVEEKHYKEDLGFCVTCAYYLVPDENVEGKDMGTFMYRIHNDEKRGRTMFIRPRGFWSEVLTLRERLDFFGSPDKVVWEYDLSHSSGGQDGTRDDIESHENLAIATLFMVSTARMWKRERTAK